MAGLMRMPGVSADAEEATLLEWAVAQGAEVRRGDVVATVETDKANVDIEADEDAVMWRLLAEPGTSVTVGSPIAVLLSLGEEAGDESALFASLGIGEESTSGTPSLSDTASPSAPPTGEQPPDPGINVFGTVSVGQMEPEAAEESGVADDVPPAAPTGRPSARVFASPIARRLARENGLSFDDLDGSGPDGRIVRADVERAVAERGPSTPAGEPADAAAPDGGQADRATSPAPTSAPRDATYTDTPHSGVRRAVAAALTTSKQAAPHFYLTTTCRVDDLLALREQVNAAGTVRVSINDFVVAAVAKSLRDCPEMNVGWTEGAVRRFDDVDVCVAISTARGLVTPVIRSADTLSLTQVSAQVRDLAARAQDGRLKQRELEGGTFTVTNLGMFGVESFSAIINPPQVAILAVGAVLSVPIAVDDRIEVGRTISFTVSADHRPVDGVLVAKWLQKFKALIEHPLSILV